MHDIGRRVVPLRELRCESVQVGLHRHESVQVGQHRHESVQGGLHRHESVQAGTAATAAGDPASSSSSTHSAAAAAGAPYAVELAGPSRAPPRIEKLDDFRLVHGSAGTAQVTP